MALTLDFSSHYLIWNDTEAVSLIVAGPGNPNTIPVALRGQPSQRERFPTAGAYTGSDLRWCLPGPLLPSTLTPKPGDVVLDAAGVRWTCLSRDYDQMDKVWQLYCVNLALANNLRDLIDIQRPLVSYDTARGAVRAWPDGNVNGIAAAGTTPYPALPARVQLLTQELVTVLGVNGFKGNHAVIIDRAVALESEDRVKWIKDGVTYYLDISGQHNPQRIDELPVLDCVIVP